VGYKGNQSLGYQVRSVGTNGQNPWPCLENCTQPVLGPLSPTSLLRRKVRQKENKLHLDVKLPLGGWLGSSTISLAGRAEWRARKLSAAPGRDRLRKPTVPYNAAALYLQHCGRVHTHPAIDPTTLQNWSGHRHAVDGRSTASNGLRRHLDRGRRLAGQLCRINGVEADVIPNLTLVLAGRFEHYARSGRPRSGKFQARFKATEGGVWLALRSTVRHRMPCATPGSRTSRP